MANKFHKWLFKRNACDNGYAFAKQYKTIEEALLNCQEPKYIVWIAKELEIENHLIFDACNECLIFCDNRVKNLSLKLLQSNLHSNIFRYIQINKMAECCNILRKHLSERILNTYDNE